MGLTRKAMKPGTVPLKRTGFLRTQRKEAGAVVKLRLKSKGMAGRTPTADEARFMDAMATLGCLACAKDGIANSLVSIHHIDGRTKPGVHYLTLALCAPHHQQDDSDPMGRISVHGSKKKFEARYGTQYELLAGAKARLEKSGDQPSIERGQSPIKKSTEETLSNDMVSEDKEVAL